MKKYFGTDGIRGIPNQDLSRELVHKVCQAVENILSPQSIAVIGDTRASRNSIFKWISEGFSSKVCVIDYGVLPSGSLPYILKEKNHDLGFIISASHNPSEYNGLKIIDNLGSKLSDETESSLEDSIIRNPLDQQDGAKVEKSSEGERIYLNNLVRIAKGIKPDQFQISIDCANGAVTNSAKKLFKELSIEHEIFNTDSDGFAINKDCGSTNPASLISSMATGNIGLTFDGDADRLIMIDEEGSIANGDVMLVLLAKYFKQQGMLDGNMVVTTVMANIGLKKSLEEMDIISITTPVGDKYVAEAMLKNSASLGGEQSGHIILSRFLPVGDGLLTAIFVLKALTFFNKKLSSLRKELITEYPQKLINFALSENLDSRLFDKLDEEIKEIETRHLSEGRIFVRASGTEPLLRVLIESDSVENIENISVLVEETISKYLNI